MYLKTLPLLPKIKLATAVTLSKTVKANSLSQSYEKCPFPNTPRSITLKMY